MQSSFLAHVLIVRRSPRRQNHARYATCRARRSFGCQRQNRLPGHTLSSQPISAQQAFPRVCRTVQSNSVRRRFRRSLGSTNWISTVIVMISLRKPRCSLWTGVKSKLRARSLRAGFPAFWSDNTGVVRAFLVCRAPRIAFMSGRCVPARHIAAYLARVHYHPSMDDLTEQQMPSSRLDC